MGIDESAADAGRDVASYQGLKQRRFANTGLADDVDVREAISGLDAEWTMWKSAIGPGKE